MCVCFYIMCPGIPMIVGEISIALFSASSAQGTFLVQLEGDGDHLLEKLQQPWLLLSLQSLAEMALGNSPAKNEGFLMGNTRYKNDNW